MTKESIRTRLVWPDEKGHRTSCRATTLRRCAEAPVANIIDVETSDEQSIFEEASADALGVLFEHLRKVLGRDKLDRKDYIAALSLFAEFILDPAAGSQPERAALGVRQEWRRSQLPASQVLY